MVGLGSRIEHFEVGMQWDVQLIELNHVSERDPAGVECDAKPVDIFGWESWDERLAKWTFGGDDRNTIAVCVNGRLVHGEVPETART